MAPDERVVLREPHGVGVGAAEHAARHLGRRSDVGRRLASGNDDRHVHVPPLDERPAVAGEDRRQGPARTAREVGGHHLAGVEVDVEQVALRRQPDQLESGWGRQHRTAELLDDQWRPGRGGGPWPGRRRSGLGRVDGELLRDAVRGLVERRRRSTGRQVTAGLRDHPDDADDDGHTGTDAHATAFSAVEWWTPGRLRHRRFERDMPLSCRLLNELDLDPLAHSPTITPQRRPAVGSEQRLATEASPGASATLVVQRTHGELAGTAG